MASYKVAINGLGRIGRICLRQLLKQDDMEIVAVNDLVENYILAHLFKYDTVHRRFDGDVSFDEQLGVVIAKARVVGLADPQHEPSGQFGWIYLLSDV